MSINEFKKKYMQGSVDQIKKYICIGGKSKKFKTKKFHPKEIAKLYKLNFKECVFFKDENRFKNNNYRNNQLGSNTSLKNFYILRPRKPGDYLPHLARLKAARLLEDRLI